MVNGTDINRKILGCVDSALETLGESVKQVVYFYMERNFQIKKNDIPDKPEAFSKALASIFGLGAKTIEELIVQKIEENFKFKPKPETNLADAIQTIKGKAKHLIAKHKSFNV